MKEIHLSDKDKARFLAKVAPPAGESNCTLWSAGYGIDGRYGRFQLKGKVFYAHRVAHVLATGQQIKDGTFIDHKCNNTGCVNPAHLQAVSARANSENRAGAQKSAKSGIRGVNWSNSHEMWVVRVGHAGVRHFGGYFHDLHEAENAAVQLRNSLHTNNLRDRSPVA